MSSWLYGEEHFYLIVVKEFSMRSIHMPFSYELYTTKDSNKIISNEIWS
jgi:hypothetical protein